MLKSILLALSILLISAGVLPQAALAGPILTQELLVEDPFGDIISIGALSFDTDDLNEEFPGSGELLAWESFTLFGNEIDTNFFSVAVGFDPDNIFAGLEFINFLVSNIDMTILYIGFFDLKDPGLPPEYTVLDLITDEDTVYSNFAPGQASVVPAPATLWLLFGALGALVLRRRRVDVL